MSGAPGKGLAPGTLGVGFGGGIAWYFVGAGILAAGPAPGCCMLWCFTAGGGPGPGVLAEAFARPPGTPGAGHWTLRCGPEARAAGACPGRIAGAGPLR